ncbi:MAG: hypothetical protein WCT46_03925 [Candidatus Gracilibacteria bacterium]
MTTITKICRVCNQSFEIDDVDQAYYAKRQVPLPTLCPKDRLKKRLVFRNERKLYQRNCATTNKPIISNVRPEAPFPVIHVDEWHKQKHEVPCLEKFDFARPFFDQYAELWPKPTRMHKASAGNEENSEYSNHCGNCRNCYFIFNSEFDEDCMYLKFGDKCRDCVDCTNIIDSELCYECVNVKNCYNLKFSDDCDTCSDSAFLRNCRGVKNSMFCYGIDHKEFCLFNEQLTREEYKKRTAEFSLNSFANVERCMQGWDGWSNKWPKIRHVILNSENCTGESVFNSKNARDCYNVTKLEDCRYMMNSADIKDSYDIFAYGMRTALCYECITIAYDYDIKFCTYCFESNNIEYCESCWGCKDCFGCIGLKKAQYHILNKPYTEAEYKELLPKIKEHMIATKEYGEFFPEKFSLFQYEDSLAQDYFPIAIEKSAANIPAGTLTTDQVQDKIEDVPADLYEKTFLCPIEQKPFKFQKKEIQFHKKIGVALPRVSFEPRYQRRSKYVPFPYV